jgi:hypothetical protein
MPNFTSFSRLALPVAQPINIIVQKMQMQNFRRVIGVSFDWRLDDGSLFLSKHI